MRSILVIRYSALGDVVLATGARARVLPGMEPDGKLIWSYREAMVPAALRELVRELGKRHTVLFSTHILSEAEALSDGWIRIQHPEDAPRLAAAFWFAIGDNARPVQPLHGRLLIAGGD